MLAELRNDPAGGLNGAPALNFQGVGVFRRGGAVFVNVSPT